MIDHVETVINGNLDLRGAKFHELDGAVLKNTVNEAVEILVDSNKALKRRFNTISSTGTKRTSEKVWITNLVKTWFQTRYRNWRIERTKTLKGGRNTKCKECGQDVHCLLCQVIDASVQTEDLTTQVSSQGSWTYFRNSNRGNDAEIQSCPTMPQHKHPLLPKNLLLNQRRARSQDPAKEDVQ